MEARTPAIASAVVGFTVRLAERRDAGAIRAIYNVEVAESTVTFDLVPRTLDEQVEWIDAHSGAHPAVVAVDEAGEVVGFGSLSPFKDRAAYSTTVEDSVYVRRDRRGQRADQQQDQKAVHHRNLSRARTICARTLSGAVPP